MYTHKIFSKQGSIQYFEKDYKRSDDQPEKNEGA